MNIPIVLLHPSAKIPVRAKADDAGADLSSIESVSLEPGQSHVVKTGVSMAIPPGFYGRVAPRSGLAVKHGVDVLAGVVDAGYRNDIGVVLINHGDVPLVINIGDRIAQLIIETCAPAVYQPVESLPESDRGTGGWGSTGVKS